MVVYNRATFRIRVWCVLYIDTSETSIEAWKWELDPAHVVSNDVKIVEI